MSYFPAYLKMDNKKILVVGGGKIAFEKLSHLLDFTKDITILADKISKEIKELSNDNGLKIIVKKYRQNDIDGYDIAIVAVDDINLQKDIYNEAKSKHILCNSVDSIKYCDFIFPSYIKKGDLVVSVSTSGASPAVAKYLRRYIQNHIPKDIDKFLEDMKNLRDKMPKGKARMKFFDEKVKRFFNRQTKS
ncbi:MAG: bifunctional precorrin-2 dehydrogenase/sirohydrochlorin ferrochelatase [Epsilonproteobacteria bacterium]|nr:bifunctional precorrin-2 dehydrogenase/sirohydrochlorin ferrochelatase [Campylobacterota bacterium]